MMSSVGHNSVSAEMLRDYVERFENLKSQKDDLSDDQKVVMADAKSKGFVPKAIRAIVKMRAMKPSDLAEAEMLLNTYRSALGMDAEPPLFRHLDIASVDVTKRDEVMEALKKLVPSNGSIQIEMADGKPVRMTRDKDGNVSIQEILVAPAGKSSSPAETVARPAKTGAPAVDDAGAEDLGKQAFSDDLPIIKNPFPFGDARRARWDKGWRDASGTDGMGPNG